MRKQQVKLITGRRKIRLTIIITALVILLAVLATALYIESLSQYKPPPFEQNVMQGIPEPPKNMSYSPVNAEGGYAFSLAGNLYRQENGDLMVYFTNPADSDVWLMCEIESVEHGVVYKSGVLKQGEYVERLAPLIDFPNKAAKIEVRVYGFEPEKWDSRGTVYLNTTLQPW